MQPQDPWRHLVLVVGAQAVPGLRVVLSVPAVESAGKGFSVGTRTPAPPVTPASLPPSPTPALPWGGISQRLTGRGNISSCGGD